MEKIQVLFLSNADKVNPVISGAGIRHINVLSSLQTKLLAEILIIDNSLFLKSQFLSYLLNNNIKLIVKTFPYISWLPFKMRLIYDMLFSTLLAIFSINKFKVISADYAPGLFFTAVLIKLLTGKKLVVYIQILDLHTESFKDKTMKYLLKYADVVLVANNQYLNFIKHPNLHETFHAISSSFRIIENSRKKYDLCFIGTVENNRKGICEYIEVAESLYKEKIIDSALIITHTPSSLLKFMKSRIHYSKIFTIRQGINQKTVNILLNQSKVFLFPTRSESFGLVIGESLKSGTPTIISNIPELNIWHNIAIPTDSYYQTTKEVLLNYSTYRNKLLLQLPGNKLLKKTWDEVAMFEANYLNVDEESTKI